MLAGNKRLCRKISIKIPTENKLAKIVALKIGGYLFIHLCFLQFAVPHGYSR